MQTDIDKDLLTYFTNVEYLRDTFKQLILTPKLTKRLLVIYGVGGVGKSSLLKMFRSYCKEAYVPVAIASGDESKSVLDVLVRWTDGLKEDGVALPLFNETYNHYRAIRAKVEEQAKKAKDARDRMVDIASKTASKTAEVGVGVLTGAVIGSVIPGIGTAIGSALGGIVGGVSAEALMDWLRGFLKQTDIDLLLDPMKKLSDDFLIDVAKTADKRRVVLMLDTFEQLTAHDDWVRDVSQRLHGNALFVIAGRALPNWGRAWPGWEVNAHIEELKPMTEEVMRDLVQRYYATMRDGDPNPAQIEAIILFACGLPMAVTSAVQLWVRYGVEDFHVIKPEIVANLVDRLMEGVPNELIPSLEAAAIVRWFDQPILRAVTGLADVREVYNELVRFPFVKTRAEGRALHDAVREIVDENLRVQDSERHKELHERAAIYFEKRLEKAVGEEAERLGLERLYHRIRADEESGVKLFQEMAEGLAQYRLDNRLSVLLNDSNTYLLERENSRLWQEYYNAQILSFRHQLTEAENVYKEISNNRNAEPKLRAYALCELGKILGTCYNHDSAIVIIEKSMAIIPLDPKLVSSFEALSFAYNQIGKFDHCKASLEKARNYYEHWDDKFGLATILNSLKELSLGQGRPVDATHFMQAALDTVKAIFPEPLYLKSRILESYSAPWTWYGKRHEIELWLREVQMIESNFDPEYLDLSRNAGLGYVLGLQGNYKESEQYLNQSIAFISKFKDRGSEASFAIQMGVKGAISKRKGQLQDAEEELIKSLTFKKDLQDFLGIPEIQVWLGELAEIQAAHGKNLRQKLEDADVHYRDSMNYRDYRPYFDVAALSGLVRIKHTLGDYAGIPPLFEEAEQLAQQYEYNDHLASLRLTQGHVSWEGQIPEWGSDFNAALCYYWHALIYALRYNRFLLDEVLWGGNVCTPLRPIIPHCLEHGEEGKRMLSALGDWWKTGVNDIGTPRPDTISPIPEGIALLDAEQIARQREPGDGSPQKSVLEQIEKALLK